MFKNWDWFSGNIMIGMFLVAAVVIGVLIKDYNSPYQVVTTEECIDGFEEKARVMFESCLTHTYSQGGYATQTDIQTCQKEVKQLLCINKQTIIWLETKEEM